MTKKLLGCGLLLLLVFACRTNAKEINVRFDDLSGLQKGDRVLFEGNTAGDVQTVHYGQDGRYIVRLRIEESFINALTEYSRFYLIGDPAHPERKAVEIRLARQGGKLLPDGASVTGVSPGQDLGSRLQQDLEAGFAFLKKQMEQFTKDLRQVPESEEYQRLKESLRDLAAELGQAEKQAREKLKDEWLPQIERELEALKQRLRDLGREQETEPLEKEVERIRKI